MIDPRIQARLDAAYAGRREQVDASGNALATLVKMMADLRGPGGCPWDAEQSLASLRQYVREEAAEVVEALDKIIWYEEELRRVYGLNSSNPTPPGEADKARTDKKGLTIAHHPHHPDFNPATSATGAPLPEALNNVQREHLDSLYTALADELGDLMLQGAFIGDILHAMGRGGVDRSLELIVEKLIRRHPHIYGDRQVADSAEVLANWEEIKRRERDP